MPSSRAWSSFSRPVVPKLFAPGTIFLEDSFFHEPEVGGCFGDESSPFIILKLNSCCAAQSLTGRAGTGR